MRHSRHIAAALLAAGTVAATGGVAAADHQGRDRHRHNQSAHARVFTLAPDPAANPEGIAFSRRLDAFFVSDTGSGAIYRGRTDRRTVSPFIPGAPGRSAVGLKVVGERLYVAGGNTGTITVYDLAAKQQIAAFATGAGGFLNDLVVTRGGDVYVTDSTRPTLWHVTAAQVAAGSGTPQALDVSSGIPFAGGFNLNGIVADGARRLVVVQSNTGRLFRITLSRDGAAIRAIDAVSGVSVPGGDGMLLDHGKLIVVQGGPPAQLTFVRLHDGASSGEIERTRTSPLLKGPSTIARAGDTYLVVNADFATGTRPFTVAGLPRDDKVRDHHGHGD
jgi:sugar lactone lactonase YvrE